MTQFPFKDKTSAHRATVGLAIMATNIDLLGLFAIMTGSPQMLV